MQAVPVQKSLLDLVVSSLGFPYIIIMPLAGLLCFVLALVVVLRGKGPMSAAALILIVHVPLFVGVVAALQGGLSAFTLIAISDQMPKPSELSGAVMTALVAPLVGVFVMLPGYLTAAVGAFFRCLKHQPANNES